ncbi:hypothetical protein GCM10010289_56480 [Streptomyces violascens]|uniref:LysR substrate-binding domain-containing protein n=1 Tax=Streptomyces violascens TaxID=67381 RepID=A0ABQ3QWB4_9ACTN|nr:hypothetical protein GCM10010289_56480 [Streptomyces violascens]GHI41545.1 hypothetical protein Sviol_59530 [Streptomyces violascens]
MSPALSGHPAARGGAEAYCGKSRRGLSELGGGRRYEVARADGIGLCVLPRLVAGATRTMATLLQAEQAEHGVE